MVKVYKYRIYPRKKQKRVLNRYLEVCQKTYNKCLERRKTEYEQTKKSLSEFDLNKEICGWRNGSEPWMKDCGIAVLHDVSRRVDKAYKSFFRRVKQKTEKPGFPRFKSFNRYDSFTIPRFTLKVKNNKIRLTNDLGWVHIKMHRKIEGETKGYTVSRNSCGDWFISIMVVLPVKHKKPIDESNNVGIDFGCTNSLTLSDGTKIPNPKFYKKKEKELAKAQRKKRKDVAAKIHKKIVNKREEFCHKLTNSIVQKYDIIFMEDIDHKSLIKDNFKTIKKSITDATWNKLALLMAYKAEDAGKIFGKVNPAYTSKKCSNCGKIHDLKLSNRTISCECGYTEDRDVNAARNILAVGLHGLGEIPRSPRIYSGE